MPQVAPGQPWWTADGCAVKLLKASQCC